jgi:hypothetical protein
LLQKERLTKPKRTRLEQCCALSVVSVILIGSVPFFCKPDSKLCKYPVANNENQNPEKNDHCAYGQSWNFMAKQSDYERHHEK